MITMLNNSVFLVISDDVLEEYLSFSHWHMQAQLYNDSIDDCFVPMTTASKAQELDATSSVPTFTPDPHAVSELEGVAYYAGLHSRPKLVYRTSKDKWALSTGAWTVPYKRQLREVFTHPITKVWNHDLGWKVVEVLDANSVS